MKRNWHRKLLDIIGSLWLAAVLMLMFSVAMACATIFESVTSPEQALAIFYRSWWFEGLLGCIGVSVLAALIVKFPYTLKQSGFVITHVALLIVLAGTAVTKYFGVEGRIGIREGQTVDFYAVEKPGLTLTSRTSAKKTAIDLTPYVGNGFNSVDLTNNPQIELDNLQVIVDKYLPDSQVEEHVTNDATSDRLAVEITLGDENQSQSYWIFADQPRSVGLADATLRWMDDDEYLKELAVKEAPGQPRSIGTITLQYQEESYTVSVEDCQEMPLSLGQTGLNLRVLRYLPHATVGSNGRVDSASSQPINPAVEVEVSGMGVTDKRVVFARYPDFRATHKDPALPEIDIRFDLPESLAPQTPLELFASPSGDLYVRIVWVGANPITVPAKIGQRVATPWPNNTLTIKRVFKHARAEQQVVEVKPVRKERVPAVYLRVASPGASGNMWVRRGHDGEVSVGSSTYDLIFGDMFMPLGCAVTLENFHVGFYPGTQRPRSYESQIKFLDAATGRTQTRIVGMNRPAQVGGFTFYQTSYSMSPGGAISYLSIARDPGKPIVFTGFIATILGMCIVLGIRLGDGRHAMHRRTVEVSVSGERIDSGPRISLFDAQKHCKNHMNPFRPPNSNPATIGLAN